MALEQAFIEKIERKAGKYDFIRDLRKGDYIDAEDTVHNWCVARVEGIDEDNEELNLHFDGWSVKYNEDVGYASTKIDAFRLITQGYTGMTRSAKRETWKYHYEDLETLKRKIEDTLQEEFDNFKTGFEATQFLRGELFVYCDCLMSNCDSSDLSKDDFRDIVEFMHQVFKLIITWMQLFPKKYMKYYEIHKKIKKAYLVNPDIAVAAAGQELIQILDICFMPHDRIVKCTKSLNLTEEEEDTDWYFTKKKDQKFKIALCYSFGSQKGFQEIIDF